MTRLENLRNEVEEQYRSKLETRDEWADWLFDNHVLKVAEIAKDLAGRYGADAELSQAAALLHDIADYRMSRSNSQHETESLNIARQLLKEFNYEDKDIGIVVDDAIRFHSCKNGERPKTTEGLILAAADSVAHLKTDFYIYAVHAMANRQSLADTKAWVLDKIERDLNDKITFEDLRKEVRPDYEALKTIFSH